MAEFTRNAVQTVPYQQGVELDTTIGCNKGYVYHRPGSSIVTLRGIVNNPNCCFARYRVQFNGNIALPTGATVGEIGLAVAIDGEVIPTSYSVITPAAVEQFGNVTPFAIIDVPRGCCLNVSIDNASPQATPGTTPNPDILVRNSNLEVTRIA